MAAKIASRNRGTKIDEDAERFVVVRQADNKRIYLGQGVDQSEAERLARTLQEPAKAVPANEIVQGRWVDPSSPETSEAA